jgi:hypothetical protein
MSNRSPFADALQIFKGNTAMSVLSLRNKPFAYDMVDIPPESGFLARQFFKMSFSRFSSFALKFGFEIVSLCPNLVYLLSRIKLAITVNGKMDNAQVNPQCANRVIGRGFGGIQSNGAGYHVA